MPSVRTGFHVFAFLGMVALSSCATAIVRNKNTVQPFKVFPATSFDGFFFWECGIRGKPLFPAKESGRDAVEAKGNFINSAEICTLAAIDMPFSVIADVLLLPVDLIHPPNRSVPEKKQSTVTKRETNVTR